MDSEWLGEAVLKALVIPPITPRQQDILLLLYQYRYLNTRHIQRLLGHKSNRSINEWTRDLKAKNYVDSLQIAKSGAQITPTVYLTGRQGISYLRARSDITDVVIRRLKRDSQVRPEFIDRKLLVADIAAELISNQSEFEIATSSSITNPDSGGYKYFEIGLVPDLIVRNESGQLHLLEVFVPSAPAYAIRKRLKLYLDVIESDREIRIVLVVDNRAQKGIIHRAIRQSRENWQIVLKEDVSKIAWA